MATLSELQAKLTEVENAITAVLTGGQKYQFNDGQIETMVERGDLKQLREMKKELEFQISDLSPGGYYGY